MKYTFLSILIFIRNAEVFIMKCHSIMNISQNGLLEKILSQFIDGFAFSHLKQRWSSNDVDINKLYDRYYSIMIKLVKSNLFSGLAHPNSLQCFGAYPPKNYSDYYKKLAYELHKRSMYVEESGGLAMSYNDPQIGMNEDMIKAMKENQVTILTASDAHYPCNVGRNIKRMQNILDRY